ncbi:MAG: tyrosine-protein phosphatase [Gammaproteobacteria bacterium]|nr:tyrosine-protein phosphatase [Gammaproteobacteria bacterium]
MKRLLAWAGGALLLTIAIIQFVPPPPVVIPAQIPAQQREAHRLLNFQGIDNFRDLGGYPTTDGRQVKWGLLYRTGTLAHATASDLQALQALQLRTLIDFRSTQEKEEEPNHLPDPVPFRVVEIPTLDEGNATLVSEIFERVETGNFEGFDPDATMIAGNRQFATEFTPQFSLFMQEIIAAEGAPVLWHCSAGKDRTGFAAAVLLRILGVDQATVMRDYLASQAPALESRKSTLMMLRLFKGEEAADKLAVLMGVEEAWLTAAFEEIDAHWGSFDNYVREGLGLTDQDVSRLRDNLLTPAMAEVSTISPTY